MNTITSKQLDLANSDTKVNRSKEIFDNHSTLDAYIYINKKKQLLCRLFDSSRTALKTTKVAFRSNLLAVMDERKALHSKNAVHVDASMMQAAKRRHVLRLPTSTSLASGASSDGLQSVPGAAPLADGTPKPTSASPVATAHEASVLAVAAVQQHD